MPPALQRSLMTTDKSKSSDSKAFAAALRLLTRRDRSETELRKKLVQFGFSRSAIDSAIEKCHDYNYLDDSRYATERTRSLMRSGRGVGRKIQLDLRRRGIDEATIRQALETAAEEFSTEQILRDQLQRRFPDFDYRTADDRQKRRVVGFFQRRGFHLGDIFRIIKDDDTR